MSIVDSVVDNVNRPYLDIDSVCIGFGPILFYFVPPLMVELLCSSR